MEYLFKFATSINVDPTLYFPDSAPTAGAGGAADATAQYYMKHSYLDPAAAKSAAASGKAGDVPLLPGTIALFSQLLSEHAKELDSGQGLIVLSSAFANDMADLTHAPDYTFMHLPSVKHSKMTWHPGVDGPLGATAVDGKPRYLMAQSLGFVPQSVPAPLAGGGFQEGDGKELDARVGPSTTLGPDTAGDSVPYTILSAEWTNPNDDSEGLMVSIRRLTDKDSARNEFDKDAKATKKIKDDYFRNVGRVTKLNDKSQYGNTAFTDFRSATYFRAKGFVIGINSEFLYRDVFIIKYRHVKMADADEDYLPERDAILKKSAGPDRPALPRKVAR